MDVWCGGYGCDVNARGVSSSSSNMDSAPRETETSHSHSHAQGTSTSTTPLLLTRAGSAGPAGGLTVTSGRGRHAAATSCVCCVRSVPDGEVCGGWRIPAPRPVFFFPRVRNIEPARCSQHTFFFLLCSLASAVPAVSLPSADAAVVRSGYARRVSTYVLRRLCTSTCHAFVLYSRTAWD